MNMITDDKVKAYFNSEVGKASFENPRKKLEERKRVKL